MQFPSLALEIVPGMEAADSNANVLETYKSPPCTEVGHEVLVESSMLPLRSREPQTNSSRFHEREGHVRGRKRKISLVCRSIKGHTPPRKKPERAHTYKKEAWKERWSCDKVGVNRVVYSTR